MQEKVNKVTPPSEADEDDEILAGVGFGPNFYRQVRSTKGIITLRRVLTKKIKINQA